MTNFHTDEYISFLQSDLTKANPATLMKCIHPYSKNEILIRSIDNIGTSCPAFPGIMEYCQSYTTGSVEGAKLLNSKKADIVINYSGGMHLSRPSQNLGYAPINDVVLAILQLLQYVVRYLLLLKFH